MRLKILKDKLLVLQKLQIQKKNILKSKILEILKNSGYTFKRGDEITN